MNITTRSLFIPLFVITTLIASVTARAIPLNPVDAFEKGASVSYGPVDTVSGKKTSIQDYRGKVVILAFWLHSCEVCLEDFKYLEKELANKKRYKDVQVITITRGHTDLEIKGIRKTIEDNNIKFPVMLDPDLDLSRKFGVSMIPGYVIIDKNGTMVTPVINNPHEKVRDLSFMDFVDLARSGKKIPELQFIPYTDSKALRNKIGKTAPDFSLLSTRGETFTMSEYKNNIKVVLAFWHPYCSYCAREMKKISDYYAENRQRLDFVLLSVASIYNYAQEDEAENFLKLTGGIFPILDDINSEVGKLYSVDKIPTVFFIDKQGVIVDVIEGEVTNIDKRFTPVLETMD